MNCNGNIRCLVSVPTEWSCICNTASKLNELQLFSMFILDSVQTSELYIYIL